MSALPERLARAIALAGPIPLSQFMAAANTEYYAGDVPLGRDFVTAPEVSQMFGELIGAWAADLWHRAGQPDTAWVELGPGRGTLTADARRVLGRAGWSPGLQLVEMSPTLRVEQRARLPDAQWHDDVTTLPARPVIVVANEFFDALPIRQLVRGADGWYERRVACQDTLFLPIVGPRVPDAVVPPSLAEAPPGSIIETAPAAVAVVRQLAAHLQQHGGALLIVDYGYEGPALGETLQAVRAHRYANPFERPGSVDLSAHVDFATLLAAGQQAGLVPHGSVSQRDFLGSLGLDARATALVRATPARSEEIMAARNRLMDADAMGTLFRALALTAPGWPAPAGFA